MAYTLIGKIEIPLEDFWEFVNKYVPVGVEVAFGVPKVNISNNTIEIPAALSTDGSPLDWTERPDFLSEWYKRNSDDETNNS